MHTKDVLAAELRQAGLHAMADRAASGYYHDFLSPLDAPSLQFAHDLKVFADAPSLSEPRRMEVRTLLARHANGEFDATREESEAWAASQEGQDAFATFSRYQAACGVAVRGTTRQDAPTIPEDRGAPWR